MAWLFGLSQGQVAGIRPLLPKERVVKRVDDRKVLSGIFYVTRRDLCGWMPRRPMAPTILYNCCRRSSDKDIFDLTFSGLPPSDPSEPSDAIGPPDSAEPCDVPEPKVLMIEATNLKAHPTASSLSKGG